GRAMQSLVVSGGRPTLGEVPDGCKSRRYTSGQIDPKAKTSADVQPAIGRQLIGACAQGPPRLRHQSIHRNRPDRGVRSVAPSRGRYAQLCLVGSFVVARILLFRTRSRILVSTQARGQPVIKTLVLFDHISDLEQFRDPPSSSVS